MLTSFLAAALAAELRKKFCRRYLGVQEVWLPTVGIFVTQAVRHPEQLRADPRIGLGLSQNLVHSALIANDRFELPHSERS